MYGKVIVPRQMHIIPSTFSFSNTISIGNKASSNYKVDDPNVSDIAQSKKDITPTTQPFQSTSTKKQTNNTNNTSRNIDNPDDNIPNNVSVIPDDKEEFNSKGDQQNNFQNQSRNRSISTPRPLKSSLAAPLSPSSQKTRNHTTIIKKSYEESELSSTTIPSPSGNPSPNRASSNPRARGKAMIVNDISRTNSDNSSINRSIMSTISIESSDAISSDHRYRPIPSTSFKPVSGFLPPSPPPPPPRSIAPQHEKNSKIRVVIRIRPLSDKELEKGSRNLLEPIGDGFHQIRIWDPVSMDILNRMDPRLMPSYDSSFWCRLYTFDRCLWSLTPEMIRSSGQNMQFAHTSSSTSTSTSLSSLKPLYCSQEEVFQDVGRPVLDCMLGGYNCSVIAFGQTGAGKSFTMMGNINSDAESFGLIPRICYGLFDELESSRELPTYDPDQAIEASDEVLFSHLEIYNENIRDLLAEPSPSQSSSPRVSHSYVKLREHPSKGVFVAGLTTVRVSNFEEVMSLIATGEANRTVAATNSNAHSSRSHAIVTLTVNRRVRHGSRDGLPTAGLELKTSQVHLVDLAGSERVTLSGAEGTRLKEANNINRSLSVLGDVIKCLGDHCKGGKGHIPFRNSTLTMLLRDSLGGNSHAVMVTAVSPSSYDYEETLSSLKYAERAKRVRMRVRANVTSGLQAASDASALELVPILQAEIQKLREMLRQQHLQQQQQQQQRTSLSLVDHSSGIGLTESQQLYSSGNSRRSSGYGSSATSTCDNEDLLSGDMMREMQDRVSELEKQLEDREQLIQSLKYMNQDPLSLGMGMDLPTSMSTTTTPSDDSEGVLNPLTIDDATKRPFHRPSPLLTVASVSGLRISQNQLQHQHQEGRRPMGQGGVIQSLISLADGSIDREVPRMINLNQDPLFSECLVYYLPPGKLLVGSQEVDVDILLTGPDILPCHCHIINTASKELAPTSSTILKSNDTVNGGTVMISLIGSGGHGHSSPLLFVNGHQIDRTSTPVTLRHHDRIAFGRFHLFRYEEGLRNYPTPSGLSPTVNVPGWAYAHEELLRNNDEIMSLRHTTSTSSTRASGMEGVQGLSDDLGTNQLLTDGLSHVPLEAAAPTTGSHVNSRGGHTPRAMGSVTDVWTMNSYRHRTISHNNLTSPSGGTNASPKASGGVYTLHETTERHPSLESQTAPTVLPQITATDKSQFTTDNSLSQTTPTAIGGTGTFEEEAQALQRELSQMQNALQERMQRYQKLSIAHDNK